MRETVIWIIFILALMLSSFESGYILGYWKSDEFRKMAYEQKDQIRNVIGRMEVLEGPKKKIGP